MSTTNNNFTVENLVVKYRNYVNEHCPKTYDVSEWTDKEGKAHFEEFYTPCSPEANVGEQLLAVIYKKVAGDNVQKDILEVLSQFSNAYYPDVLTEEEMAFLCENYKETVEYLFAHRDEWTAGIKYQLNKIPRERERLVKEYAKLANGSTVFIADTEYCDLAVQFPSCTIKGFTGLGNSETKTAWALGQIRMWALGIKSEIVPGEGEFGDYSYELPEKGSVDLVILRANGHGDIAQNIFGTECNDINALYDLLKPNGRMVFFSETMDEMVDSAQPSKENVSEILELAAKEKRKKRQLSKDIVSTFRIRVVNEHAIETIVSFVEDSILGNGAKKTKVMLVLNKADIKSVRVKSESKGISRDVEIKDIDGDILWPGYYLANRPKNGISLSKIASYSELFPIHGVMENEDEIYDAAKDGYVLSERAKKILNMFLVVTPAAMAKEYKDANLCYTNLKENGYYFFEKWGEWIRIITRPCVLLYGRNDKFVTGYVDQIPSKEKLATLLDPNPALTPNEGIATLDLVSCITPKAGVDVRYITALLFSPEIKEQIITICEGYVNDITFPLIMDKVIVPNHTDKERLAFLSEANYEALVSSQREMKQTHEDYKKAVRMRKHALSQSLSSIEATFYALNAYRERNGGTISDNDRYSRIKKTTVKEGFEYLSKALKSMLVKMDRIADVEYTFSEPIQIDPELFAEEYIAENESAWTNFKPIISWIKGHNQYDKEIKDPNTDKTIVIGKGESINTFMFPKDALKQIFDNIISNALSHGFIDESRKDYKMRFSWETDGIVMKIIIENNGAPIPSNRSTESLLEYGVSTALNQSGHNGIGCNEIDGIMRKYDGKVSIISSPDSEFTVKYVLTFNRATIRK